MVALEGGVNPEPARREENVLTDYHVGLVGDGGEWGGRLRDFFRSDVVTDINQRHGLSRPSR